MARQAHARLTFLIDPDVKRQFEAACAAQDLRPSQLMRHMIKAHIAASEAAKRASPAKRPDS
jgi:antitoxin component of RelBE/YafQ-DinJ toxin-antitoxin module